MTNQNLPEVVPFSFGGDPLQIVIHEFNPYVAMRPIVENLGIRWSGQHAKLVGNKEVWGVQIIWTPSKSGMQETLVMPIEKLPLFFATIKPNKVHSDLRPKIIRYQKECAKALWAYWTRGSAVNPRGGEVSNDKKDPEETRQYLTGRLQKMQNCLLDNKPRWRRIYAYKSIGLTDYEISRILGITLGKLGCIAFEMHRGGIVLPERKPNPNFNIVHPEPVMITAPTDQGKAV